MTGKLPGTIHLGAGRVGPLDEFLVEGDSFRLVTPAKPHGVDWFVVTDRDSTSYVLRATLVRPASMRGRLEVAGQVVYRRMGAPTEE